MRRLESAAPGPAGAVATYRVTITMSQATVEALTASGCFLYAFRAVEESDRAGVPVTWLQSTGYSLTTVIQWQEQYQVFTSPQVFSPSNAVRPGASYPIAIGQTLEVLSSAGTGSVLDGGVPGAIAIVDATSSELTCGVSLQPDESEASPICAFPLYGNGLQLFGPALQLLLLFSPLDGPPGTPVKQAWGSGVLIDFSSANAREVAFDINAGWSWDGGAWADSVQALADIVSLLVQPMAPPVDSENAGAGPAESTRDSLRSNDARSIDERHVPRNNRRRRTMKAEAIAVQTHTLTPGQYTDIAGTTEVKVSNASASAGAFRVKCPDVPAVDYAVAAHASKNIQIPIGDSRFTNTGTVDLTLTW